MKKVHPLKSFSRMHTKKNKITPITNYSDRGYSYGEKE